MFDEYKCRVYYKGKLVLTGGRGPVTELWQLPTNPTTIHNVSTTLDHLDLEIPATTLNVGMQAIHQTSNLHTLPYTLNQLKHMRHSMFSPPIATLTSAINNGFQEQTCTKVLGKISSNVQGKNEETSHSNTEHTTKRH